VWERRPAAIAVWERRPAAIAVWERRPAAIAVWERRPAAIAAGGRSYETASGAIRSTLRHPRGNALPRRPRAAR
jgi:hypothetical protein